MTQAETLDSIITRCCQGCGLPEEDLFKGRSYLGSIVKEATIIINVELDLVPMPLLRHRLSLGESQVYAYRSEYVLGRGNAMARTLASSVIKELSGPAERHMALLKAVICDSRLNMTPAQLIVLQSIIKDNL